jgi:hypothetical protein
MMQVMGAEVRESCDARQCAHEENQVIGNSYMYKRVQVIASLSLARCTTRTQYNCTSSVYT